MRELPDLIGKRYGKLVVTELLPANGSGHRRWLCQCDCGNTHEATTGNLNSGHATHCGCVKSPDLSGQTFGQITVLARSESKRKRGDRLITEWLCRCECGAEVFRTTDQLTNEKQRMCAECARKNSAAKAFKGAGFEAGTQISKIKEMNLTGANTSGCRGVYWHKRQQKWVARLTFKGKVMNFGSFSNYEDAVKARQRGKSPYGSFDACCREKRCRSGPRGRECCNGA